MDWQSLGYREYPFNTSPIGKETLSLFVGHPKEVQIGKSIIKDKNFLFVAEGKRGVGTTSFVNYLRFRSQDEKLYFTPSNEIGVENSWSCETLLSAVIASIVRELEFFYTNQVKKEKAFIEAKSLSQRLSESYNQFGISAFSFGANFGKSSSITQPVFVPSTVLGHHIEDLGKLAVKLGYQNGIAIQLNNLDLHVIHQEETLQRLLNAMRDFIQIKHCSWFLVGDVGLCSFISRKVDRLDDIVNYKLRIESPNKTEFHNILQKRLDFYKAISKPIQPFESQTLEYLYDICKGRLRYIFGIMYILTKKLRLGDLVEHISHSLAKEGIKAVVKERIFQHDLTLSEEEILKVIVKNGRTHVSELAKQMGKNRTFVSQVLNKLFENRLVEVDQEGTKRFYSPSIDSAIAFLD